jgi:hypothetical protein
VDRQPQPPTDRRAAFAHPAAARPRLCSRSAHHHQARRRRLRLLRRAHGRVQLCHMMHQQQVRGLRRDRLLHKQQVRGAGAGCPQPMAVLPRLGKEIPVVTPRGGVAPPTSGSLRCVRAVFSKVNFFSLHAAGGGVFFSQSRRRSDFLAPPDAHKHNLLIKYLLITARGGLESL